MQLMSTVEKAEKRLDRRRLFQISQHGCHVQFLSVDGKY